MPINNLIYRENLDIELGGELLAPPELSHLKTVSNQVLVPPPKLLHCNDIRMLANSSVFYCQNESCHYYAQSYKKRHGP